MSELTAQIGLYPLGQGDLSPAIDQAIRVCEAHGLRIEVGPMSTMLVGDDAELFPALHEAAVAAMRLGRLAMVVTVSNACASADRLTPTRLEAPGDQLIAADSTARDLPASSLFGGSPLQSESG